MVGSASLQSTPAQVVKSPWIDEKLFAAAHSPLPESMHWPPLPTVGRPVFNSTAYLLDSQLEPVPLGAVGEVYIGGTVVARMRGAEDQARAGDASGIGDIRIAACPHGLIAPEARSARASAVPYMLEAHRRVWSTDVGMNRFMERAPRT